jgi:hypothetical protein
MAIEHNMDSTIVYNAFKAIAKEIYLQFNNNQRDVFNRIIVALYK